MSISEHPIARNLPRGSSKPQVLSSPDDFDGLMRQSDTSTRLEDWIHSDRPQLDVYMARFEDSTFIRMTSLHCLMDAVGRSGLLQGWTAKLRGRDDQIPRFQGFSEDPMASMNKKASPQILAKSHQGYRFLGWFRKLILRAAEFFDALWRPEPETRMVCVPAKLVDSQRELAMKQLEDEANGEEKGKAFVSEGDVLLAWWMRTLVSAINPPSDKTITIANVFNVRPVFPDLFPKGSMYLGNTIMAAVSRVSTAEVIQKPLGFLAGRIRESLVVQRRRDLVESQAALQARCIQETGESTPPHKPLPLTFVSSNRHQARFFDVDFSAAVLKEGVSKERRSSAPGKPFFILSRNLWGGQNSTLNYGTIAGKGPDDCWWMSWRLPRKVWKLVEKQLADDN